MLRFDRKQQNSVKQLSLNKKNKLIKKINKNLLYRKKKISLYLFLRHTALKTCNTSIYLLEFFKG